MRSGKYSLCVCLVICLIFLSGCGIRSRVIPADFDTSRSEQGITAQVGQNNEEQEPDAEYSSLAEELPDNNGESLSEEPDPNAPSEHDPESERREYHDNASAELVPDEDKLLISAGKSNAVDANTPQKGSSPNSAQETDVADLKATELITEQEAEQLGVSEEAPRADTVFQFYQTLLESKVGSLFECKRLYVYWETSTDYQTIFKTSVEHNVIQLAGGYDVAVKRKEDALLVDDGWIERKGPGCIVKCVSSSLLGRDVRDSSYAEDTMKTLLNRPGWSEMVAIKSKNIIILSEELLTSKWGQLSAALYLAKVMYPDEMEDVDTDEALKLLAQEALGMGIDGTFSYTRKGGN